MSMMSAKEEEIILPAQLGMTNTYEMNNISAPELILMYLLDLGQNH